MAEQKGPRPSTGFIPIGVLILLPAIVATLALDVLSGWGRMQWLATVLLGAGLVSAPYREVRGWGLARTGLVLWIVILLARGLIGGVAPHARLLLLPTGSPPRLVDRMFEERDATILGARLMSWTGFASAPEFPTFAPLLASTYDDMEVELGHRTGSVVLSTLFGNDTGDAFGAFVVESDHEPVGSVVFLHGYGGNMMFECWQVAVAARAAGMRTVCPSTSFSGTWSNDHGERIARAALAYARRSRVLVLVGLSAGAIGASHLAPDLEHDIDGLVLISGADPDAGDPLVPTLVLQGANDSMTPASLARDYRDAHPNRVRYVEMDATHFLILEQHAAVRAELTRFLLDRLHADGAAPTGASR